MNNWKNSYLLNHENSNKNNKKNNGNSDSFRKEI